MTIVLATGVICILVANALLHAYWALGGRAGTLAAVPQVHDRPAFRPSTGATFAVAVALFAAALVVASASGLLRAPIPMHIVTALTFALAFVFLASAIGELRLVGFFRRVHGSAFARADSVVFSPLCLLLAVAVFIIGWSRAG